MRSERHPSPSLPRPVPAGLQRFPRCRWALFAGVLLLTFPIPRAAAAAVMRTGPQATVASGERVEDDVYLAGSTTTIEGTITGDLVAAGGTVTVNGRVEGDLWATGGTVTVNGPVRGSVRVASGSALIGGPIGEDLLVAAGELRVASSATVGRDLWLSAGEATLAGRIGRDLHAVASQLTQEGRVEGRATLSVEQLRMAPGASIGGDLTYSSPNEVDRAPGAQVGGRVERTERELPGPGHRALVLAVGWLRALVGLFLFGLLFLLLFPRFSSAAADTARSAPGRSLGFGLLVLLAAPLLALLVFLLGLLLGGWWIALFLLALYALFVVLALPTFGFFLGRLLLGQLGRPQASRVVALLSGLVLLLLVLALPWVGGLAALLAIVWGLGALAIASAGNRPTASLAPPAEVKR